MQRAHQLTGGIEIRGEVVHAKKRHGSQQTNLPGAMNMSMLIIFFHGSNLECQKM